MDSLMKAGRSNTGTDRFGKRPPGGLAVAIFFAALMALGSALFLAYSVGYRESEEQARSLNEQRAVAMHGDSRRWTTAEETRLVAAIGFALSAAVLVTRKAAGFIVAALAMLAVGGMYIIWYLNSLSLMSNLEIKDYAGLRATSIKHFGPFINGIWWDILVLAVALSLLIWLVRKIVAPCSFSMR